MTMRGSTAQKTIEIAWGGWSQNFETLKLKSSKPMETGWQDWPKFSDFQARTPKTLWISFQEFETFPTSGNGGRTTKLQKKQTRGNSFQKSNSQRRPLKKVEPNRNNFRTESSTSSKHSFRDQKLQEFKKHDSHRHWL